MRICTHPDGRDKNITAREVLVSSFPGAELLICLYHTFCSFNAKFRVKKLALRLDNATCALRVCSRWHIPNVSRSTSSCVCNHCYHDLDEELSIVCDHCLSWHHLKCVGLKQPPKSKNWYCRVCHSHPLS